MVDVKNNTKFENITIKTFLDKPKKRNYYKEKEKKLFLKIKY